MLCRYVAKSAGSDQVSLLHDLQGHPTEGSAAVEGHQTVDDRGRKSRGHGDSGNLKTTGERGLDRADATGGGNDRTQRVRGLVRDGEGHQVQRPAHCGQGCPECPNETDIHE